MEAIILAGGFGTRLRAVVSDVPKPMAPIGNVPFLALLLQYLEKSGFNSIVLSVGFMHDKIIDYFGNKFGTLNIRYAIEDFPLGTGGGICQALKMSESDEVFILNGDTFISLDYQGVLDFHRTRLADITMALMPLKDTSRYGNVRLQDDRIIRFEEKGTAGPGLINAGIYLLNSKIIKSQKLPEKFSFEQDFLAKRLNEIEVCGYISDTFFIDIGVPEDYQRAQTEIPHQFELMSK